MSVASASVRPPNAPFGPDRHRRADARAVLRLALLEDGDDVGHRPARRGRVAASEVRFFDTGMIIRVLANSAEKSSPPANIFASSSTVADPGVEVLGVALDADAGLRRQVAAAQRARLVGPGRERHRDRRRRNRRRRRRHVERHAALRDACCSRAGTVRRYATIASASASRHVVEDVVRHDRVERLHAGRRRPLAVLEHVLDLGVGPVLEAGLVVRQVARAAACPRSAAR